MDDKPTRDAGLNDVAWWWYLVALVAYVSIGYFFKSVLLNWIVGPLFLLFALYVVPTALRRLLPGSRS